MNKYKSISSDDANEHRESRRMEVKPLHLSAIFMEKFV